MPQALQASPLSPCMPCVARARTRAPGARLAAASAARANTAGTNSRKGAKVEVRQTRVLAESYIAGDKGARKSGVSGAAFGFVVYYSISSSVTHSMNTSPFVDVVVVHFLSFIKRSRRRATFPCLFGG